MQRLTWSGIALHESGSVPNYPASHGCVRLPRSFAKQLFGYTDLGAHVIITDEELALRPISGKNPFEPSRWQPDKTANSRQSASVYFVATDPQPVQVARNGPISENPSMVAPPNAENSGIGENFKLRSSLEEPNLKSGGDTIDLPVSSDPVRILITRRTGRELVRDIQNMLNEMGFEAGEADGWMGPSTGKAIIAFQKENELSPNGTLSMELTELLRQKAGGRTLANGHIYVRQAGKTLFDIPIMLGSAHRPLGTHFLAALPGLTKSGRVKWVGATLSDSAEVSPLSEISEAGPLGHKNTTINDALSRIELPAEIREKLTTLSIAGSSVVINDHGISRETLRGTDFVVLTNTPLPPFNLSEMV